MKLKIDNYTIGALAKFYGVSTDTIRLYDRKGILVSEKNDENNYRVYCRDDMITMDFIIKLRQMDIPLNDVKKITGDFSIAQSYDYSIHKLKNIEEEIRNLTALKGRIEKFARLLEKIEHDLDKIYVKQSPTFILRDIKDGIAAANHSFERLGLDTIPMLTVCTENQFDPVNMELTRQTDTRADMGDFYICQEDDKGIANSIDLAEQGFLVLQPRLCIHTVVKALPTLDFDFLQRIKDYAEKHNFQLTGQCLNRIMVTKSKGIHCADYYECWYLLESD